MKVFIDESGDLGWKFDAPRNKGGSSRFFTIAGITCPENKQYLLSRLVTKIFRQWKIPPENEPKGYSFNDKQASLIAKRFLRLLNANEDIKLLAVIVYKQNVYDHLREDQNSFYNYVMSEMLIKQVSNYPQLEIVPDKRSVKVKEVSMFPKYFKRKLRKEYNHKIELTYTPTESHTSKELILIDWLCNFIWRKYENKQVNAFEIFKSEIQGHLRYFDFGDKSIPRNIEL